MESEPKNKLWWKPAVAVFGQVSGWIIVPLVLALILGKYLDGRFGTEPWLFIGLTCVGFLISSFGIVKVAFAHIRDSKNENGKPTEPK